MAKYTGLNYSMQKSNSRLCTALNLFSRMNQAAKVLKFLFQLKRFTCLLPPTTPSTLPLQRARAQKHRRLLGYWGQSLYFLFLRGVGGVSNLLWEMCQTELSSGVTGIELS